MMPTKDVDVEGGGGGGLGGYTYSHFNCIYLQDYWISRGQEIGYTTIPNIFTYICALVKNYFR